MIMQSECSRYGLVRRMAAIAVAAVLALAAYSSTTVQAGGISQLEYLQWLVQLAGDTGQFSQNSSGGDYINWARGKGMDPKSGWNLNGKLTKQVLAETLSQFLSLNPGKQRDYLRELRKIGVELPEGEDISRSDMAAIVDSGLQPRASSFRVVSPTKGNNGLGNGEDPPPPGWLNPRNPHFGQPQNDGPGHGPGNPGNKGGN